MLAKVTHLAARKSHPKPFFLLEKKEAKKIL